MDKFIDGELFPGICEGEPSDAEVEERIRLGNHQLGYKVECPVCEGNNTEFVRLTYHICHTCKMWFHTMDSPTNVKTEYEGMIDNIQVLENEAIKWDRLAYELSHE